MKVHVNVYVFHFGVKFMFIWIEDMLCFWLQNALIIVESERMQFTCLIITAKLRHSRKIIICSGCVHDDGGVKPERTWAITYIDRKTDIAYDTSVKKNISKIQLITMFQH